MRRPEKDDTGGGFVDATKMTLVHFTAAGSSKRFFDDNSSEAMGNEQQRPRRLGAAFCLQADQKIPCDCALIRSRTEPMTDMSVISVREDARIRDSGWDKISWPI